MIHVRIRNTGESQECTNMGWGCQAAAPTTHKFKLKKKKHFVDMMISNVLCDLPFR
jgi:hypothetical protein